MIRRTRGSGRDAILRVIPAQAGTRLRRVGKAKRARAFWARRTRLAASARFALPTLRSFRGNDSGRLWKPLSIMPAADDLDLSTLPDDELVAQMHDDLYDGLKPEIEEAVRILLARRWTPYDVLTKALVEGMRIVGIDFRDGILFVPEVLLAANAMKAGMEILRPLLAETGVPSVGKVVIGDGKGDIHRHRQNPGSDELEGGGFEVVDLRNNTDGRQVLAALDEHQP